MDLLKKISERATPKSDMSADVNGYGAPCAEGDCAIAVRSLILRREAFHNLRAQVIFEVRVFVRKMPAEFLFHVMLDTH